MSKTEFYVYRSGKEEMPDDVYDLLVNHEVNHALFTPKEDCCLNKKRVYQFHSLTY